jgi:hypothetical protein
MLKVSYQSWLPEDAIKIKWSWSLEFESFDTEQQWGRIIFIVNYAYV